MLRVSYPITLTTTLTNMSHRSRLSLLMERKWKEERLQEKRRLEFLLKQVLGRR